PSTTQGKFVVRLRFSMTGPATPKQAAIMGGASSDSSGSDASAVVSSPERVAVFGGGFRNSSRISSSDLKSALANVRSRAGSTRSVFQSNRAKIVLVPPMSPARIIFPSFFVRDDALPGNREF